MSTNAVRLPAADGFGAIISAVGLPPPIREYRFAPPRRWRFDYCWPDRRIALEIEGGTWNGGRHVRGKGYERDCQKYNAATLAGWTVLRVTTPMVRDGRALALLEQALSPAGDPARGEQEDDSRDGTPDDSQQWGGRRLHQSRTR